MSAATAASGAPYLSDLHATRDSPLYTTYAAAKERSEFILDEGYHLRFYQPTDGIDLVTDSAGDWCLAFRRGDAYVHELRDMARAPVITLSYPDMVKYHYFPFEDIRVDVTFLVHSSRAAVQEITLSNLGDEPAELQVIPFLRNEDRCFQDLRLPPGGDAAFFTHEEFPDGWMIDHDIPHVDLVRNVFLVSPPPERLAAYRRYGSGPLRIPLSVDLRREREYLIWGRIEHADGERCRHAQPGSSFLVVLGDDRSRILTDSAPRWGSARPGIDDYGYFRVELGNFGPIRAGDHYSLCFRCGETGQCGILTGAVSNPDSINSLRRDLVLGDLELPRSPGGLEREIPAGGGEIRLRWQETGEEVTYKVYRRNYRQSGVYELLSARQAELAYTDDEISGEGLYGYLVTAVDAAGRMSMPSGEVNSVTGGDFSSDQEGPGRHSPPPTDLLRVIAAPRTLRLAPGASTHLRVVRAVAPAGDNQASGNASATDRAGASASAADQAGASALGDKMPGDNTLAAARRLLTEELAPYVAANEQLYSGIPRIACEDPDTEMLYWNAFTLLRQVMLPPEGSCGYNYYVFSREPTWGWGHGGQVFHESLAMLAYAYMDPEGARDSQRIYSERQHPDGYINYRSGPYLDETIPTNGQLTSSAPWYAWINWEIHRIAPDKAFLAEMYRSSAAFYRYVISQRDSDGDGLCEWGAHAVLESVRDALAVVWDEVAWPSQFEALDMNAMLVQEAGALALMADELGLPAEASAWREDARRRSEKINRLMWDEATGFYYHVDLDDHDFTHETPQDLKRREIIGFLPLWAGIADEKQARRLVDDLTDPERFGRPFGPPTLAADDPYYDPRGYWNGPVWVEWAYLVQRGLMRYGYEEEARDLTERVAAGMIAQLKADHTFWEFYSPDEPWGGYHQTYIWAGIISRMLLDARR